MNDSSTSNGYLIIFRGSTWEKGLSPQQLQGVVAQWTEWFQRLTREGKAIAGNPLEREGKVVSGKKGRTVADGPFAESKEAIGGYFLLAVDDMDEAVAIAQECPALEYGMEVEVRPIAGRCTVMDRVDEMLTQAVV
jgi:hypothetical protein